MKRFLLFLMPSHSYLLRFLVLFLMFSPGLLFSQDKVVLDSLHIQLNHSKEDSTRVKTLWDLSVYYLDFELSKSLYYSFQALEAANKIDDPIITGSSYAKLGNVYLHIGIYNEGLKNLLRSLEIFEEIGNVARQFLVYKDLGTVYYFKQDYDKALEYYFNALSIYNNSSGTERLVLEEKVAGLYNNIGNVYSEKTEYETASQYFMNALDFAKEKNDDYNQGVVYNNLGKLALHLNKRDEAFKYFQTAIEIGQKKHQLQTLIIANSFLATYYLGTENVEKALEAAQTAAKFADEHGNKGEKQYVLKTFFQIYQAKKQYKKALDAYIHYKEIRDSLQSESNLKEQVALQLQYEFDKKEKIREAVKEKLKFQYGLIISILTLGFIITGLLYRLAKNRTKRIRLEKEHVSLEKKNLEKDLELKNKELTTNVMYLLKKNELISSISNRLLQLKKKLKKENQEDAQRIIFDLQAGVDSDVWDEFEMRFLQVHNEFYLKLKDVCSDLTPAEVKLCAFLRLNMTSKEISAITHQSVKSIEVARARVRKKLDLTGKDVNLVTFLSELEG